MNKDKQDISSESQQMENDANQKKLETVDDDLVCCDTDVRSHSYVNSCKNTVMIDNKDLQVLDQFRVLGLK